MNKALHDGLWFVLNHFLSVRRWEPKFLASNTKLTYTAIWSRLPELPIEVYDLSIFQKVGNKIGRLLKVDTCTSSTSRGRYARICIEVPLEKPLQSHVFIGTHRQQILYVKLNMLCITCGRVGHTSKHCPHISLTTNSTPAQYPHTTSLIDKEPHKESPTAWKIIVFPRRHPHKLKGATVAQPTRRHTFQRQDKKPTSSSSTSTTQSGTPHISQSLIPTNHGLIISQTNTKDVKLINSFNLLNQLDSNDPSIPDPQPTNQAQHPPTQATTLNL